MASQIERSKHIVEKDFSPPESVVVFRPAPLSFDLSGSICMFSTFLSWSNINSPRNCRSVRRNVNWDLAPMLMYLRNLCHLNRRVFSALASACDHVSFCSRHIRGNNIHQASIRGPYRLHSGPGTLPVWQRVVRPALHGSHHRCPS